MVDNEKEMSKSICFFVGNINHSGGTERVAIVIANALAEKGYQVSILSLWQGDQPFFSLSASIVLGSLYKERRRFTFRYPAVAFKLRRYVKENKINVLVDVESMLALYSVPALGFTDIRHITWEHFNFKSNLGLRSRQLARLVAARFSDVVVTLTERDRQFWVNGTSAKAKIVTIPNPVPFELPEVNYDADSKIALAVGRLTYQKGFDMLIEAWAKVAHHAPGWKLRIVGSGEDEVPLKDQAARLNVQPCIEFIPNTSDVHKHYQEAAFYCLSSRYEGFPMVLLEAQAYGLPIVAFDCDTGPAEIVNSDSGVLVSASEIELFSKGVLKLINSCKLSMSQSSKKNIRKYSKSAVLIKWEKVLNGLFGVS